MRIAIAGLCVESSTFSLDRAVRDAFVIERGDELVAVYDWPRRLGALVDDVEWVPIVRADAFAAGEVEPDVYDEFEREILDGLRAAGALDGVYLDMHGAMKVAGRFGAEERLVGRIREVVGPDVLLSISMDPHGNMSEELVSYVDLAAVHRHAPHIDTWETRERAVRNLIDAITTGKRPLKAWVRVPVLLPGERTSTVVEPAKSVFGAIVPTMERHGFADGAVLDAGIWVGFAWADEPRCSAAVVVTGFDEASILACARELAQSYWDAREGFVIVTDHSGTWDEGLDFFLSGDAAAPLFLADSGDNVTAGATGDLTSALQQTIAREDVAASRKRILFAGIVDAPSVQAAIAAGPGAVLDRSIGAVIDSRYAEPVPGPWTVESIIPGFFDGGAAVGAVLSKGTVSVSVQGSRVAFLRPTEGGSFENREMPGLAWTDIDGFDAVVVKNGYLFPGQVADAGSNFMAITPGGTDLDFDRLQFTRLESPVFPFVKDFEADLTPKLVP